MDNKADRQINIDYGVWKMLMKNGYDFVFDVSVTDGRMHFYHTANKSNACTDIREFVGLLCPYVVEEEQQPFSEQMTLEYVNGEIARKGEFVRTVHFIIDGERYSKSIRMYPHAYDRSRLMGFVYDTSTSLDYDWMTDEYARLGFTNRATAFLNAHTSDRHYFLIFTNIKGFKAINDLFGEQSGDMVIFQTRDILYRYLKPEILGRLEDDHFVLIVDEKNITDENLEILASQTYMEGSRRYDFSIRCGIYPVRDTTVPVRQMIDRARLAEKSISDTIGHSYMIYNESVRTRYLNQQQLISDMNEALAKEEFIPFYQPVVDAHTFEIRSAEALVRWNHGKFGMVSPGEFIPAFEDSGQISLLDRYMVDRALEFNRIRSSAQSPVIPCAVNLSRVDFYNTSLMDYLLELFENDPGIREFIRLEVTESAYADLENNANEYLKSLKALGVKILLDDYGSGMSSLSTLETFEFDVVKLDMGFIRRIGIYDKTEVIIRSTIDLSHALGAVVTAEGVENEEQLKFLQDAGCDYIQGYYFYKPMPGDELSRILDASAGADF